MISKLKLNFNLLSSKFNRFYVIKLLSSFLVQFSALFLVYLLPVEEYGYLALLMSVSSLMFVLTSGWNNGAVINLGSKSYSEKGSYNDIVFYRAIMVAIVLDVLTIFFVIFKVNIISFIHKSENYYLAYLLFMGLACYDFSFQLLYPGNKDQLQSALELTAAGAIFLCMIFFVKDVKSYVFFYSAISALFAIVTIFFFFKYFGPKGFSFVKKDFFNVLNYSLWQILSVVGIYVINVGMNYIFVFNKITPTDIGEYNFSFKLFSGFSAFFGLFGILIPKWIHGSEKSNLASILNKRVFYITAFLAGAYLIIALVLRPFIEIIGKKDYLPSVSYFLYLFPAFLFMSYTNLMNTIIANTKHYKFAQYVILIQVIILLLVCYPLVYFIGVKGAIIATTVSYVICSLFFYLIFRTKIIPALTSKSIY